MGLAIDMIENDKLLNLQGKGELSIVTYWDIIEADGSVNFVRKNYYTLKINDNGKLTIKENKG